MDDSLEKRKQIFGSIYKHNLRGGRDSKSGSDFDIVETAKIRAELLRLFRRLNIKSILDIPCGDLNWFSQIKLSEDIGYIGADIVQELIDDNKARYPDTDFRVMDIIGSELPRVDLVLCRDLLGYYPNNYIELALANIKSSGARFLLATTFPKVQKTVDIEVGRWRPINMEYFGLKLIALIDENLVNKSGENSGKMLGLYRLR